MRAWRVHELGHPSTSLRLEDIPAPEPGPGRVRVCRLEGAGFGSLEQWARTRRGAWDRRLDRLGEILGD